VQQETAKALALPALKERLLSQGAIPSGMSPADFTKLIDRRDEEVGRGGEGFGSQGRLNART
jgi:tripartite-type tricarboxylate transporter receptor subunit TctC